MFFDMLIIAIVVFGGVLAVRRFIMDMRQPPIEVIAYTEPDTPSSLSPR